MTFWALVEEEEEEEEANEANEANETRKRERDNPQGLVAWVPTPFPFNAAAVILKEFSLCSLSTILQGDSDTRSVRDSSIIVESSE